MSRAISTALQQHLNGAVTTTCRLLLFTLKDGREFGLTTLDRDVIYQGVTYSATNGFDPSAIASDTGLSVDNAEGYALIADVAGITDQMIATGALDDASWQMMLVNWNDLSMGSLIIDGGDVGQVNLVDGVSYVPELISISMRLRQPIGHFFTRKCRATFGTDAEGMTGCGYDADPLWLSGTVDVVEALDNQRVFTYTGPILDPVPNTARVRFTSGANAGPRLYQVEAYSPVARAVELVEPTPFPIAIGDGMDIRPDCDKSPAQCTGYNNWLNYKGYNLIPVSEADAVLTPQTGTAGGLLGSFVE